MTDIEEAIGLEVAIAEKRYGDFTSTHEVYGVLAEEIHELMIAIHENDPYSFVIELIQVAAVAKRAATQFDNGEAETHVDALVEVSSRPVESLR